MIAFRSFAVFLLAATAVAADQPTPVEDLPPQGSGNEIAQVAGCRTERSSDAAQCAARRVHPGAKRVRAGDRRGTDFGRSDRLGPRLVATRPNYAAPRKICEKFEQRSNL